MQVQEMIQNINRIDSETSKKIAISFLILFVVCVAQLIIHEVVLVVDSIPVFSSLMEVVGIYVVGKFVYENLLTVENRTALVERIKSYYQTVVGQ